MERLHTAADVSRHREGGYSDFDPRQTRRLDAEDAHLIEANTRRRFMKLERQRGHLARKCSMRCVTTANTSTAAAFISRQRCLDKALVDTVRLLTICDNTLHGRNIVPAPFHNAPRRCIHCRQEDGWQVGEAAGCSIQGCGSDEIRALQPTRSWATMRAALPARPHFEVGCKHPSPTLKL